jgi:hypothetical protein
MVMCRDIGLLNQGLQVFRDNALGRLSGGFLEMPIRVNGFVTKDIAPIRIDAGFNLTGCIKFDPSLDLDNLPKVLIGRENKIVLASG